MNQPAVSVIIPTYNSGQFVGHAIESVLAQSFDDVEIIVVDDGSTDGTASRVGTYGAKVRYVERPHAGPGAARNHGAGLARAEWLAFLDADDFWYPHKLADQLALVEQHPMLDYITGNFHIVDEDGCLMGESFADHSMVACEAGDVNRPGVVFGPESRAQYARDRFGICTTMLVRADLFHRVGGFSQRFYQAEDIHLMLRLVGAARSFGAARRPVAAYRRRNGSTSHRQAEQRHRVTAKALRDLLRYHALPRSMAQAVREQVAETQYDLAYLLARQGRRLSAMIAAGRSFLTRPGRRGLRMLVSVNMPIREDPPEAPSSWIDPVELFRFGVIV